MNDVSPQDPSGSLCVLASGSSGNCTVLAVWSCGRRRIFLVDAGISPRRTERRLAELGFTLDCLDGVLLTHLDVDHWHSGWIKRLPAGVPVRVHERHVGRARREGLNGQLAPFGGAFELCAGVRVGAALASHDSLGVASFCFEFTACGARLGFATDLGRVTEPLVEHLRGVDVLAIESNYCPQMQLASSRPGFLKRRIMGGSGHLSNQETLRAVEAIQPRSHLILLHLSRECNRPELVADLHAGADYAVTISVADQPTRWVPIARPPGAPRAEVRTTPMAQFPLFAGPRAAPAGEPGAV